MELLKYILKFKYKSKSAPKSTVVTYIRFIIDTIGYVTNVEIYRSSGDDKLDEAVKVHISNMPKWYKPAIQYGNPLKCNMLSRFGLHKINNKTYFI